jgi:hypothetical protein
VHRNWDEPEYPEWVWFRHPFPPASPLDAVPARRHLHPHHPQDRDGSSARLGIVTHSAHHLTSDLLLTQHDVVSAIPAQVLDLGIRVRAGKDDQVGIGLTANLDQAAGLKGVRNGADQPASPREIGCLEQPLLPSFPDNDLDALSLKPRNPPSFSSMTRKGTPRSFRSAEMCRPTRP